MKSRWRAAARNESIVAAACCVSSKVWPLTPAFAYSHEMIKRR